MKNKEFELYISTFEFLNDTEMQFIDKTLNEAAKHERQAVFVVPYKEVPKDIDGNLEFWRQIRASGDMTHSRLSPFARYFDLKRHIDRLYELDKEDRKNMHITFMEMDEGGNIPEPQKSFSYIPKNIANIHGRDHLVNGFKLSASGNNKRNSPDRVNLL